MKHQVIHVAGVIDEYLIVVDDETKPKVGDWCLVYVTEKEIIRFDNTIKNSLIGKVIAHVPLYNTKPLEGIPFLPEPTSTGKCKVEMDVATLYKIFSCGFDLGSNEGPFPKEGTFNAFHNAIVGKPMTSEDNSYFAIKDKIRISKMPTEFFYEGYRTNKEEINWFGIYTF